MKYFIFPLFSLFSLVVISCDTFKKNDSKAEDNVVLNGVVGNDKDSHGCIRSAGYVWSELKQECVKPFELEIKFKSIDKSTSNNQPSATFAAFAQFSEDKSKAELFLPSKEGLILNKEQGNGSLGDVWVGSESNDQYKLGTDSEGKYAIYQKDNMIYIQDTP